MGDFIETHAIASGERRGERRVLVEGESRRDGLVIGRVDLLVYEGRNSECAVPIRFLLQVDRNPDENDRHRNE